MENIGRYWDGREGREAGRWEVKVYEGMRKDGRDVEMNKQGCRG